MQCEPGSLIRCRIYSNGKNAHARNLKVPPVGHSLQILLDNDCDHNDPNIDFPFYYNDPGKMPPRYGVVVPKNETTMQADLPVVKGRRNGRVACNAMIASELDGHSSLWTAL